MITKTFEIRDSATFIPILAVKTEPGCEADRFLFARAGYGRSADSQGQYVLLVQVNGGKGKVGCDPNDWLDRTYATAHQYIQDNFDVLDSGAVVDVQYILGETKEPKASEALE